MWPLKWIVPRSTSSLTARFTPRPAAQRNTPRYQRKVIYVLTGAVRDKPCRVYTSDLRIYVEAAGFATFPEGSVICGPVEQHEPSPDSTALNATVLLEVTSDSSEEYDNTVKLEFYRTIPTSRATSSSRIANGALRSIAASARNGSQESRPPAVASPFRVSAPNWL